MRRPSRDLWTTVAELLGVALAVVGVAVMAGVGLALVVAGVALVGIGYLASGGGE